MGWISVDTRLPKKLEKVLFHWMLVDSFGTPCVKNVSMGYMCDEGWNIYLPYHSFGLRADVCPVTHWRHLPDFPKFKIPVREVGKIIIDDPLNGTPDETYQEVMAVAVKEATDHAKEFAKKFCEKNADLLKRLADR